MQTTTISSKNESRQEWFETWFNSAHYQNLYAHRDADEAAILIDGLVRRLNPSPGALMLDLGCGTGRHLTVVRNIAQALKPEGMVVIDYLNVPYAENHRRREDCLLRC